MGLPHNLPAILRGAGLKVVEHSGWKDRGHGNFKTVGVLCHHTATKPTSRVRDVLNLLIRGRSDLAGPLCNLGLDRDGTVHIIAAGKAYHAGRAKASGSMAANSSGNNVYIGIEAFNSGTGEKWNKKQYDAYVLLCAVLSVKVTGNSVNTVRAHKETSVTGKIDPYGPTPYEGSFDMGRFRTRVNAMMKKLNTPGPAPSPKPKPTPTSPTKQLSVMTWNVENKGDETADAAEVREILAKEKPDVVCLQEAYKLYLSGIPGYREVYHASKGYPAGSENAAQAILVRDGVSVKVKSPIVMKLSWLGPKMGIKHDPRVHRYVTVNKDRQNWRVSTWHVPFGAKPVEETRKAAVSWLRKMGVLGPAIAVGDWNALAKDTYAKIGKPAGARVDGGHLDKAIFKGCTKVKGENLGKRGRSDHDVKIWTFKK